MLKEADVLGGGEFAGLMDDCRMLESVHEKISSKILSLKTYGDPDRICGIFATDPQTRECTSSYVLLTSRLAERRNAVKRATDTDISKASVTDDIDGWRMLRDKWLKYSDQFEKIAEWNRCKGALADEGLGCIADAYSEGLEHDRVLLSFKASLYIYLIDTYTLGEPCLVQFDSSAYEKKAERFRAVMKRFIPISRKELNAEMASSVPDVTSSESPEIKALQQAIVGRGKGVTIRSILDSIHGVAQEVCPCVLMGTSSVPFYLGDNVSFDTVVVDDASLIPLHESVGLLTRGNNAVIIGDAAQIRVGGGLNTESLLDAADALPLPRCDLKWLYVDESLAEFSNLNFYGNGMNTFPAAGRDTSRLKSVSVTDKRIPPDEAEAEAVVKRVMVRMRERAEKRRSVGVVVFSEAQKKMIEDKLNAELVRYPKLEAAMLSSADPFFVKMADDVHRCERDSIIISLGISKDENGNIHGLEQFSADRGELMINAAVSSSKKEVSVFTSLTYGDIPDEGPKGVTVLKDLLEYTEKGAPATEKMTDGLCDSVAKAIEDNGFRVRKNIGSSKAMIDIGILDPEYPDRCILGILLDGSEFAGPNGMDANFGFMNILEGLGWNIRRLWAVDWLNDRDAEMKKIIKTVKDVLSGDRALKQSDVSILDVMMIESSAPVKKHAADPGHRVKQLYAKANLMEKTVSLEALFSNSSRNMVERDVMKVVETESPVAVNIVAERILDAYRIKEIPPKLFDRMVEMIDSMDIGSLKTPWNVKILWDNVRGSSAYITYRVPPKGEKRDMKYMSAKELMNAIIEAVLERPGSTAEELITEMAELFGHDAVTEDIQDVVTICISMAVGDGLIRRDNDGRIFLRSD
jgi:hypothetical protein